MPIDFSSIFDNSEPDRPGGSFLDFSSLFEQERLRRNKLRDLEEAQRLGAMQYQGISENLGIGPEPAPESLRPIDFSPIFGGAFPQATPPEPIQPFVGPPTQADRLRDAQRLGTQQYAGISRDLGMGDETGPISTAFQNTAGDIGRTFVGMGTGIEQGLGGLEQAAGDLFQSPTIAQLGQTLGEDARRRNELVAYRGAPRQESTTRNIAQGVLGGAPAFAIAGVAPELALPMISAQAGGEEYGQARSEGATPLQAGSSATTSALGQAILFQFGVGPLTKKLTGEIAASGSFKAGVASLAKDLGINFGAGVASDLIGRIGRAVNYSDQQFGPGWLEKTLESGAVMAAQAGVVHATSAIPEGMRQAKAREMADWQDSMLSAMNEKRRPEALPSTMGPESFFRLNQALQEQRAAGNIPEPNVEPIAPISNVPPVNPPTREEAPPVGPEAGAGVSGHEPLMAGLRDIGGELLISFSKYGPPVSKEELASLFPDSEVTISKLIKGATSSVLDNYRVTLWNKKSGVIDFKAAKEAVARLGGEFNRDAYLRPSGRTEIAGPMGRKALSPGPEAGSPILFAEEPGAAAASPIPGQSVGVVNAEGLPRTTVPRGETAATTPGEPRRFGLALPELVELSKAIIGKVPQVSPKMREGVLGFFKGTPTEGKIKLRADLGKNPAQAAQTVAHELGHAADWADEHDLARGNVLGRLAKLKKSMVSVLNFPTGTLTEKIARQELEAVSRVMRPDLWQAAPKSKTGKYVRNSRELYADAFSLLMHNPDEFSRLAPESSKAWWNHLDKAPNLKGTLEGFWRRASEGQGSILDAREAAMKEQHRQGAERLLAQARPEPKTLRQKVVAGRTAVLNLFYDKLSPLYRWKNQAAKKSPQAKEAVRQAIDAMNEVAYQGTADAAIIESTTKNLYDRVEAEGIDKSDLSVYLTYRRMAGERAEFLNPGGIDKEAADQGLAHLEKRLGSDKIQKLREIWDDYFKSTRLPIIEDLVADTSHGEKLGEKALSNPEYVRFRPLKYIQEAGERGEGWALKLHKQLGTFEDIGDPVLETLLQDLAMSRFTARNKAAKAVKRAAELMGESEDATVYFDRSTNSMKAREPKEKNRGLVAYRQDGKEKGFYVPKEIAQTFDRSPEILGKAGRALEAVVGNKIIRNILVVMQPAFAAVQAIKDPMTAIRNAPGSNPLKFARAFGSAAKDLAPVFLQHLKGKSPGLTADEVEARLHRAIISPGQMISATFGTEGENVHDAAFAAFAARAGLSEKAHQMMVQKPLAKLMDRAKQLLMSAGEFENRWVKLAGWKYLKQNYEDMPTSQRAAIIRERWGNPDPYRAGSAKAIYDALSLFSNVSKEGLRSTVESFKDNPGAYTLKSVAMHMVPAVIGAMIKHGFFDDDEEKKKGTAASDVAKKGSTYLRTNYIAAPLGMTSDGKGAFLTIPLDYVGAMIHSVTYRVADRLLADEKEKAEKTGIVGDTLKAFIGMLPFADFSPTLESAGMLVTYARGGNPRDTYRDQDVLSPNEAAARGSWPVTKKVLKAAWNNSYSTMLEFETDTLRSEVNGDVKTVMGFGDKSLPILSRFVRFTDAGDKEAEYRAEAADRAEKAPGFIQLDIEIAKLQHGNPNLSPYEGMKALRLRGLTPGKDFMQRWNRIKQKPGLQ